MVSTQFWPILLVNLTVKSYGTVSPWDYLTRPMLMIQFALIEIQFYVDYQSVIQYTITPAMTFNEWPLLHAYGNVRNYWYSEWRIPWTNTWPPTKYWRQNAVSYQYIFNHQRVNISLWLMLESFTRRSKVNHSEIGSFFKCGFLPPSCISQFVTMVFIYINIAKWE